MNDPRTLTEVLTSAIHQHMPSATIVGIPGVSEVDFENVVARLYDTHADAILSKRTPDDLGVSRLTARLMELGETNLGRLVVKRFKEELMFEAGRRHFGRTCRTYADVLAVRGGNIAAAVAYTEPVAVEPVPPTTQEIMSKLEAAIVESVRTGYAAKQWLDAYTAAVELTVRQFRGFARGEDSIRGASILVFRVLTAFGIQYGEFYAEVERKLSE